LAPEGEVKDTVQLICISRGSYRCGKAFAESLARELSCVCISREDLLEKATLAGIAAGKLEMACVKNVFDESLESERERYQAFVSCELARAALNGPVVYHGLAGHLLLSGVNHVLRVRVKGDKETRIQSVQTRLGLDRCKAEQYIEQLDEDRSRWVRTLYDVDWDDASGYDFIINPERADVENIASAFCSITRLPEFQETPASRQALEDLLLSSSCRLALASDDRTQRGSFQVHANRGVVSVICGPQDSKLAETVEQALSGVPGVANICCSTAVNRILWIQENFGSCPDTFQHVIKLAKEWDAAVDLLAFKACQPGPMPERQTVEPALATAGVLSRAVGGASAESPNQAPVAVAEDFTSDAMEETFAELAKLGRAGGRTVFDGTAKTLISSLDRRSNYSLVVLGEVFLGKSKSCRARLGRELASSLNQHLHVTAVQAGGIEGNVFSYRRILSKLASFALRCLSSSWFPSVGRRFSKSPWYMFCVRTSAGAEFAKPSSSNRN
jgi:hypothetical protein